MDENYDDQIAKSGKSFIEEPVEYIKTCYNEAKKRNDDLRDINVENQEFYEGKDRELEERKSNTRIKRSAVYIPELKPAIDTRMSGVLAKTEEKEHVAIFRPADKEAPQETLDKIYNIQSVINQQMRDCGYLTDIFREHIMGAEIYRTPSTVKVGWEPRYEKEAVLVGGIKDTKNFFTEAMNAFLTGGSMPNMKPKVEYVNKYKGGQPFVEWLEPDRFLYEPNVSSFKRDSSYAMDAQYMSYDKLISTALEYDWDVGLIRDNREKLLNGGKAPDDTISEEVQSNKGLDFEHAYKDGKILVLEIYIIHYNDDGEREVWQDVLVGDKYLVKNELTELELIDLPFVPITANRMPATIESLSSIDTGKHLQRLYNESFNVWLDSMTYRAFPPMITSMNQKFSKAPVYEPLALWKVSDPDGIRPLVDNPGSAPDLVPLMGALAANIRNLVASPDLSQGFNSAPYEKATSSKLRFASAATRAVPTFKDYGIALVGVATMFLHLNQQYAENKEDFVVEGGMVVDAPSLTGVSDPDKEKQEVLFLYTQALSNPAYQSPGGMLYLANLWREAVRSMRPHDYDKFVPSQEELEQEITAKVEAELAQGEKQSALEQMTITQQGQPLNNEKGGGDEAA